MAQHSIPFISVNQGELNLSKAEVNLEFEEEDEINNSDFMTNLGDTTLQVLSNIESYVGTSFLNYEKISPAMSAHLKHKFLSQVSEALKYEKVNPTLEKTLPSIREKTVKKIQDSFHVDPTLSFVFGTPSTDKDGKLITNNSRKNLFLKRDDVNTYLELVDNTFIQENYYSIENDSIIGESSKEDLLDCWRAEFKTRQLHSIPAIQMKDVLFTSSLFMDPLNIEMLISSNLEPKNPILQLIQAQSISTHEDYIGKLKGLFKYNNLQWMGTYHSQCLRDFFGTDLIDVTNVNNARSLSMSIDLDNLSSIAYSFLKISENHRSLCNQVFEENNSSALWRDFYLDNYQVLNPMKDLSESILENSIQHTTSLRILKEIGTHQSNNEVSSNCDWISLMKSIANKLHFNKSIFCNFVDELDKATVKSNFLELSSIIMKFYYSIHQVMTELVEILQTQSISELFIVLLLISSIGNKTYSIIDFSFSNALKSRYFHTRFVELILHLLHQQDDECKFQSIAKDIQMLSFLNVCLIGFRDGLFLSKIKIARAISMELISNTQSINRSYLESPILNICKIRIGNNYMLSNRTTARLLVYNHLKIVNEKSKEMKSIEDKLLLENMFVESKTHESKTTKSDKNTLKGVNLISIKDQQVVKNSYKFLDDQLKEIIHEMRPKSQKSHQPILNDEKDDFEDILDSLSSVCEVIIVPSEDSETLTRSPSKVKKMLLESLPSLLFEMLHTFPDSVNHWLSFIVQQTMSFLKTLECCQIISLKFKIHGEKSVQLTSRKVSFVDISMFLAMQCANALFQTIRKNIEPFSKILFEMCLIVENFLIPDNEANNASQNIQSLKAKLEKYALTIQEILKPDSHYIIQSIRNQVGQEEFIDIINHLQVENEEGLSQILEHEILSFTKQHIIQERLLDYHLCMNQFYGEYLENMIPLGETIEYLKLSIYETNIPMPNRHYWREQLFLSLDFEEYAEILQQVLDSCPKDLDENAESSTLILLQQLILVLGNYPFHKLLTSTENDSIPYLHPIIHSSVISKIASDPLIQQEITNMKPSLKVLVGKLFDALIRKCCQAKMEFNMNYIKSVKHELIKSLHESHNLAENYRASNMVLSDKLHNFLIKNYSRGGEE
ncbi:predicted protein [Naegleria gruberi]|uniref:Predicted protein n=1 Tax=Naegleria gruberi TaxID=5762 RepID=D2VI29_NAEGR|nr:uncharacterized protein NAEGRDRAFT_68540 [Naegleria gruberi]EFC43445.1 predicted protein [Naegleria gruberi]|eukprot:XP_002676189.1 predicted protein [Naegleria gruberi strain NEG-M]